MADTPEDTAANTSAEQPTLSESSEPETAASTEPEEPARLPTALVYDLAPFFTPDAARRRAAFGFVAVSAGFGWLIVVPTSTSSVTVERRP